MRAFSLVTLSPEAFDDFSAHHADGNFQQTSAAGRLRAGQGIEVEYLGVQENGTIVAGALFETHRSRLSTFSVVHDGPLCDYRDRELTEYTQAAREGERFRTDGNRAGNAILPA